MGEVFQRERRKVLHSDRVHHDGPGRRQCSRKPGAKVIALDAQDESDVVQAAVSSRFEQAIPKCLAGVERHALGLVQGDDQRVCSGGGLECRAETAEYPLDTVLHSGLESFGVVGHQLGGRFEGLRFLATNERIDFVVEAERMPLTGAAPGAASPGLRPGSSSGRPGNPANGLAPG